MSAWVVNLELERLRREIKSLPHCARRTLLLARYRELQEEAER